MDDMRDTFETWAGDPDNGVSLANQETRSDRMQDDYDDDGVEIDPLGVPQKRFVIFTRYAELARWDDLNLGLPFTRQRYDDVQYQMIMFGRRPSSRKTKEEFAPD